MDSSRRDVLRTMTALGGSGFSASVAGCMGAPSGSTGQQTEEPTSTPAPTPTPSPTPPQASVSVEVSDHSDLGRILVDGAGMTLYMFVPDEPNVSNCTGGCAEAWPPVVVESADAVSAGMDVSAEFDTFERADGSLQITANGMPLYYFVRDKEPGDATGQEAGNVWFVLRPDGTVLEPTVSVREHDDLGLILTNGLGRTLYIFTNDSLNESVCTGGCAEEWPPLTVEGEDALVESVKADVTLGTIERGDGSLHVTVDEMPLYYYAGDEEPGDASGQGVNGVWYVLTPDGGVVDQSDESSGSGNGGSGY